MENNLEELQPFTEALMKTSNLDVNQAKTLVYYCLLTYSDKQEKRPILVLDGESGTGKSDLMKVMYEWCNHTKRDERKPMPEWVEADRMTEAVLRDELADSATAFVEEADKTSDPARCEGWYKMRYDITSKGKKYRRQTIDRRLRTINKEETHDHFGYTVLHVQNAFQSTEMDRRTIRVTIFKDTSKIYKITKAPKENLPIEAVDEVDWDADVEQDYSGSAWDAWLPLMRIAERFKDTDWLAYARQQIDEKNKEDNLSKVYELKGIVFSEIAPVYELHPPKIAITAVRQALAERGYNYTEKQIAKAARDLGFTIYYPGNKAHIKFEGKELLERITERMGLPEDEDDAVAEAPKELVATATS